MFLLWPSRNKHTRLDISHKSNKKMFMQLNFTFLICLGVHKGFINDITQVNYACL